MPVNYRRRIPEVVVPGKPLGRHVNHDARSLAYRVQADGTVASARWDRMTPVLDQGDLGSCTGNAACGVLGTDPFFGTLGSVANHLDEASAVALYSSATQLDDYPGAYPPDDTGSDGLSVAKACKAAKLISGYQHITSVSAAQTAIQSGPFIVGNYWYADMDKPSRAGLVHATGSLRGGHEYECIGYNATTDAWEFVNSWSTTWGVVGHFFYSTDTFTRLLASDGDATVFTPLTTPAPTPAPDVTDAADHDLADATYDWSHARHTGSNAAAARAVREWRAAKGL